ncbi:MAG: ROK family transcriptional regulator [Actinomycetia bacterium]|nr:ROK family transcriptional regulator [Actinomycetes bacterium]
MPTLAKSDMTRSAVLTYIGGHGPTSRADLARALSVSPALMTQVTKSLLDDGLIAELENSPSRGGRPGRLLGLVSAGEGVVGVKVAADNVTVVEVGIDGTVQRSASEPFRALEPDALDALEAVLRTFLSGAASSRLLGIGVATPGTVGEQSVGVVESTQLGWAAMPVGHALRRAFGLPVLVDNNVNALAMAEILYGRARGCANAVVVTIGTGVGAAVIVDGTILRGHAGGAGEIGHIPMIEDGPVCQCGARGCLEALVGEQALVAEARERGILDGAEGIDRLREAAADGDPAALGVFARAGHLLGRALAGVVNTLDPEAVILLGEGVTAWPYWAAAFERAFRAGLVPALRAVPVSVETWQDDRWAQGAACLVLGTPFDAQGISGDQGRWVRERLADAAHRGRER